MNLITISELKTLWPVCDCYKLAGLYRCNDCCHSQCPKHNLPHDVARKLDMGYKSLLASKSMSLLKKHLTEEVYEQCKNATTSTGATLLDCVQSGFANHDSGVGLYAPDPEAYLRFASLFDPVIEEYHLGFKKYDVHPPLDWGDLETIKNVDPEGKYVISTRVRCGRALDGFPFNPKLTKEQYEKIQEIMTDILCNLEGGFKGQFYPLAGMSKEIQKKLIDDHFLFKEGDRFLQAAKANRYWPTGRGIYINTFKSFLVWVNEEDHIRIISMQPGGDLGEVYKRMVKGVKEIERRVRFTRSKRLGYLTFCPSNLGTTIRASVHITLPKLASNKLKFEEVASKYHLQVRGTRGEHTEAEGGVYDISNKRRLGLTEYQAVKEMYDGIIEIIKLEESTKTPTPSQTDSSIG